MSSPNDGGPAFPCLETWWNTETRRHEQVGPSGMSLRDYFAGQALAGLVPMDGYTLGHADVPGQLRRLACNAYELADAMLAAREKRGAK